MPLALLPFLLLVIPIMEIAVFIAVGKEIGLWPTLAMVLATAVMGSLLLRHQGFRLLGEIRSKMEAGALPGRALVHGVMLLLAGILLLTPGFVTDFCGFLLFIPPVRDWIWAAISKRIDIQFMGGSGNQTPNASPHGDDGRGRIIDLDESEFRPSDPTSPWREK